jgi:hypothetical protein
MRQSKPHHGVGLGSGVAPVPLPGDGSDGAAAEAPPVEKIKARHAATTTGSDSSTTYASRDLGKATVWAIV